MRYLALEKALIAGYSEALDAVGHSLSGSNPDFHMFKDQWLTRRWEGDAVLGLGKSWPQLCVCPCLPLLRPWCVRACVCAPHRLVPQTIGVWGQLSSQGGVLVEPPLCFQITVTGLVSVEWSQ